MRTNGAVGVLVLGTWLAGCGGPTLRIDLAEYEDKVYASWLGQCIGNMYGLSHEHKYQDQPRTEPIEDWMPDALQRIREFDGSFSDDDTDIEYVMLFCMEEHGPEPTYAQVAEYWKRCINSHIWVANRAARDLMDLGYLPPLTGRKDLNVHWYQIDPQLVCEIWAVTTPGMIRYAAAKADWAAKITNDDYGTHPTIWYNTMYAASFFEKDVERLCQIGYEHVPPGSIFRTAIDDVREWKREHGDDWVAVREKIKRKYHDREGMPADFPTGHVGAVLNGALGVLALLYGEGDFEKTMNYACMAGYDADNQCATLAGLVALMHGSASIPRKYTHVLPEWTKPLNDFYKNRTRDEVPDGRLTDMAQRTAAVGRRQVVESGGRVERVGDREVLVINTQAEFFAPLEVRLFPIHLEAGEPATVEIDGIGGRPSGRGVDVILAGALPPGMQTQRQGNRQVLAGTPRETGQYDIAVTVFDGETRREQRLPLFVHRPNLARSAERVLAAVTKPKGSGSRDVGVLRDGDMSIRYYDSFDGANTLAEDFYGYEWPEPVRISSLVLHTGPVFDNGGWFETLGVQYQDEEGHWQPVADLECLPPFDPEAARQGKRQYGLSFKPVSTKAIRVIGRPGGSAQFTSVYELVVPRWR